VSEQGAEPPGFGRQGGGRGDLVHGPGAPGGAAGPRRPTRDWRGGVAASQSPGSRLPGEEGVDEGLGPGGAPGGNRREMRSPGRGRESVGGESRRVGWGRDPANGAEPLSGTPEALAGLSVTAGRGGRGGGSGRLAPGAAGAAWSMRFFNRASVSARRLPPRPRRAGQGRHSQTASGGRPPGAIRPPETERGAPPSRT